MNTSIRILVKRMNWGLNNYVASHNLLYLVIFNCLFCDVSCKSGSQSDFENGNTGYFNEMPRKYKTDSLEIFKDLFNNLKTTTEVENGVSYLHVESGDCKLIPFCGYLKVSGDTIFHAASKSNQWNPFLIFNAKLFSGWTIKYSTTRIDSITYFGKRFDIIKQDSIPLFLLTPLVGTTSPHESYLRYISIRNGGIQSISISNQLNDITIQLIEHPKVVYWHRK